MNYEVVHRRLRVDPANPFDSSQIWSYGNASFMLIRQYNFPDKYTLKDDLPGARFSDRVYEGDPKKLDDCIKKYGGFSRDLLHMWLRNKATTDEVVMSFIKELFGVSPKNPGDWTGYRVLCDIHGNGRTVWTFQLFQKHPKSRTKVYSGDKAPNVMKAKPVHR